MILNTTSVTSTSSTITSDGIRTPAALVTSATTAPSTADNCNFEATTQNQNHVNALNDTNDNNFVQGSNPDDIPTPIIVQDYDR